MRMRPRGIDVLVTALIIVACAVIQTGRTGATSAGNSWLDWVALVTPCLPLLWRSRHPYAVFWLVMLLVATAGATGARTPAIFLVPLAALHAVARYRPAWQAWSAVAATVLAGFLTRPGDSAAWTELAAASVVTAAVALTGINQRTRQAYLSSLEDHARRLERERDQQARLAVAGERARIAREMHDVVAHHLTVMVALSEGAAASGATSVMTQVSATGRQALGEMRRLVGLLREGRAEPEHAGRVPQPGLGDLDALIDQVRGAGVRVAVVRDGEPGAWGPGAELAIYRIVQEALTNTLKHVGPRAGVEVRLRCAADTAEISVVDDGAGRPARPPEPSLRHGLLGMDERAAAYGGRVEAGPRDGAGWRVHAALRFGETTA